MSAVLEEKQTYAQARAQAIKQYRFLLRVAREARLERKYYMYVRYRNEAENIKLRYNL